MGHWERGDAVQIGTNVQGTVAADVAAVSIAAMRRGGLVPAYGLIQIVKYGGTGDVTLPAPVKLIGTCAGRRVLVGVLNLGAAIAVGDNGGYQEPGVLLALCDALVIVPGGALGGAGVPAYDAYAIALWEMG